MRICYTSDLHGELGLYDELTGLLESSAAQLCILGGDMLPDGEGPDPVGSQLHFLHHEFMPRVRAWQAARSGRIVATILGNHDWRPALDGLLEYDRRGELVLLEPHLPRTVLGVSLLGYSLAPPSPFWVKDFERLDRAEDPIPAFGGALWDAARKQVREVTPEECFRPAEALEHDLARVNPPDGDWILVAHAPPHDTALDRLPTVAHPIGSRAVRDFILRHRPRCGLHGHIHESPRVSGTYRDVVGETLCINPGQGRELHAVTFESDDIEGTMRHTVYG